MDYIQIYSIIIIFIKIIFFVIITTKDISFYKKWLKYFNKMKDKDLSKCHKNFEDEKCLDNGEIIREKIYYIIISLILEILCLLNPKFYILTFLNDLKLFNSMILNLFADGEFNEQTIFIIIKIIFDIHIIFKKDLINKF